MRPKLRPKFEVRPSPSLNERGALLKNRKFPILFGAILVLLLVVFGYITREQDPIFKGKPLSAYLESIEPIDAPSIALGGGLHNSRLLGPPEPRIVEADSFTELQKEAISEVGAQGLPMLVRLLRGGDSKLQSWLRAGVNRFPALQSIVRLKPPNLPYQQPVAAAAFKVLGNKAAPAIPKILTLLHDPGAAFPALAVLMYILPPDREEDILSLTNIFRLQSTRNSAAFMVQSEALLVLGRFGKSASGAAPFILKCLISTNERIRATAAVALARMGTNAEQAVPLMIDNLSDAKSLAHSVVQTGQLSSPAPFGFSMRESCTMMTLWALGHYGKNAETAFPFLTNLYHALPSGRIRREVYHAAAKIGKETGTIWELPLPRSSAEAARRQRPD